MEKLIVSKTIYREIVDRSEKCQNEVCGLLFSDGSVLHAKNVSDSESVEYQFSPEDYGVFLNYHRGLKTDKKVVGIYHSHPRWSANPSYTDIRKAYPNYMYLIYSCTEHLARAFVLEDTEKRVMKEIRLEVE